MKTSKLGWLGKTVRNQDGRTGTITAEYPWGPCCELTITAEDGTIAKITLRANDVDSGDAGWQWRYPEFSHGPAWLPLGDKGAPISMTGPPKTLTVQDCNNMHKHRENYISESRDGKEIILDGWFTREDLVEIASTQPSTASQP